MGEGIGNEPRAGRGSFVGGRGRGERSGIDEKGARGGRADGLSGGVGDGAEDGDEGPVGEDVGEAPGLLSIGGDHDGRGCGGAYRFDRGAEEAFEGGGAGGGREGSGGGLGDEPLGLVAPGVETEWCAGEKSKGEALVLFG